jgi:V/A-type H+-transporting ATPase subunit C
VQALATTLLTTADIERLLAAESEQERYTVLRDTYLASYLLYENVSLATAIDKSILASKQLLDAIAPTPRLLHVLWFRYDVHNLRVILKGQAKGWGYEEVSAYFSSAGVYEPEYIYEHCTQDTLYRLSNELHEAYHAGRRLVDAQRFDVLDTTLDRAYFAAALRTVEDTQDTFVQRFTKTEIDLHNIFLGLRTSQIPAFDLRSMFVSGGTITAEQCADIEHITTQLEHFGGFDYWQDAFAVYRETGHTTYLDVCRDNYRLQWVSEVATDMFSPAVLFAYALRVEQAGKIVRAVMASCDAQVTATEARKRIPAII